MVDKSISSTEREKYDITYGDGTFEIVFDKTIPSIDDKELKPNYMIECELKSGNSSGLYFIDKILRQLNFIEECEYSKKEIAIQKMKKIINNPFECKVNQKEYNQQLVNYFISSPELLEQLKLLDKKKEQIKRLREKYGDLKEPLVITLSGTPRAGKTTCIDNLFEFFKKSDLKTKCLEEPAGLIYQTLKNKEEKKKILSDRVGFVEQQYEIGSKYIEENLNNDIILCDRGVLDTFVWYDMYYQLGMMDEKRYKNYLLKLKDMAYKNQFYALFASKDESMKRDYFSSLSIEPRTTMSPENVERYNSSLLRILPIIESKIDKSKLIDTTNCDKMDASITIANEVLDNVKKLYLRE